MAKRNLIIGATQNYDIDKLKPWVLSAKEVNTDTNTFDVVLCYSNTSEETLNWLKEQGVITIPMAMFNVNHIPIHVLRFMTIYDYLKSNYAKYNCVLTTDVKDVYFQKNPFDYLDSINVGVGKSGPKLIASSESLRYKDEPWGDQNLKQTYGQYVYDLNKNNTIYNVGVFAGVPEYVKDLAFNIFTNSVGRPIPIVDQAVYNVLIQTQPYKDVVGFLPQSTGWAVQLGTTGDPTKMEYFRPNLLESEPFFDYNDGLVKTFDRQVFHIVHQYDRVPDWKKLVQKKYGQDDEEQFFTYKV
mgnify:CR=1 FL=1